LEQCKGAYGRQAENRGSDDHKSLLAEVRAVAPMDSSPPKRCSGLQLNIELNLPAVRSVTDLSASDEL